jgi:hypothetical protein
VAVTIMTRVASVFGTKPGRTRKVVDSNCLQSEALKVYLSAPADNYVVLTDYAAMEAYKGDTLKSIYRSMEILAQHPQQVIVLRGTQEICALQRPSCPARRESGCAMPKAWRAQRCRTGCYSLRSPSRKGCSALR